MEISSNWDPANRWLIIEHHPIMMFDKWGYPYHLGDTLIDKYI